MSQEELAHKASLHATYIGQLERGEKNATLESIEKITRALDITFEDLFRYIQPAKRGRESTVLTRIVSRLQGRSIEDQKAVLRFLDLILDWKDRS